MYYSLTTSSYPEQLYSRSGTSVEVIYSEIIYPYNCDIYEVPTGDWIFNIYSNAGDSYYFSVVGIFRAEGYLHGTVAAVDSTSLTIAESFEMMDNDPLIVGKQINIGLNTFDITSNNINTFYGSWYPDIPTGTGQDWTSLISNISFMRGNSGTFSNTTVALNTFTVTSTTKNRVSATGMLTFPRIIINWMSGTTNVVHVYYGGSTHRSNIITPMPTI